MPWRMWSEGKVTERFCDEQAGGARGDEGDGHCASSTPACACPAALPAPPLARSIVHSYSLSFAFAPLPLNRPLAALAAHWPTVPLKFSDVLNSDGR